ncbi:WYL domain-containing protein [Nocardioidaceae bacterium]|nr:WYL domain-containing protein [Nocardioidaceae bacterium]
MTTTKSERLLNLLIAMLVQRHFVSKETIRQVVPQYHGDTDEAFERKFERDKDELRSLGVPIEVGFMDSYFEDEQGYRIRPEAYALPEVTLDGDEAAVVGLAARVWQNAGLASATSDALMKLRAAGADVDPSGLDVVSPRVAAPEPAFDPVWEALGSRTRIAFDYRRGDSSTPETRHVEPWGVVSVRSRSYLVGFDRDRDDHRVFRLSRVVGPVRPEGGPGAYDVPADTDVRGLAAKVVRDTDRFTARLRVRPGRGHGLRRRAVSTTSGGDGDRRWDEVAVELTDLDAAADEVLSYGSDVVVDAPDALRERVVGRLRVLTVTGAGETR